MMGDRDPGGWTVTVWVWTMAVLTPSWLLYHFSQQPPVAWLWVGGVIGAMMLSDKLWPAAKKKDKQ